VRISIKNGVTVSIVVSSLMVFVFDFLHQELGVQGVWRPYWVGYISAVSF
jgi:hypothetical protein